MYLNIYLHMIKGTPKGLTLTWDVFKYNLNYFSSKSNFD